MLHRPPHMTKNPDRENPGGMDWSMAQSQEKATPEEGDDARSTFGPGWHTLTGLQGQGMTGDQLFRLLRANLVRLDGWLPHLDDEPVYIIFF